MSEYNRFRKNKESYQAPKQTAAEWDPSAHHTNAQIEARIWQQTQDNDITRAKAYAELDQAYNTPGSGYYAPYKQATSSYAQALANAGYDTSDMDKLLADNHDYMQANLTWGAEGTPSKPSSKTGTQDEWNAYNLYRVGIDHANTKAAQAEMDSLAKTVAYYAGQGLTDDEIRTKVGDKFSTKYPWLNKIQESYTKGNVIPMTGAMDFNEDTITGMIWAARNGDTSGDWNAAAVHSYLGHGRGNPTNQYKLAQRTPGSKAYHPYLQSTMDDVLMAFGMTSFDPVYMNSTELKEKALADPVLKELWGKWSDGEERTQNAEKELADVNAWVDGLAPIAIPEGQTVEEVAAKLVEDYFKYGDVDTLKKLDEARYKGDPLAVTRGVNYRLEDIIQKVASKIDGYEAPAKTNWFDDIANFFGGLFGSGNKQEEAASAPAPTEKAVPVEAPVATGEPVEERLVAAKPSASVVSTRPADAGSEETPDRPSVVPTRPAVMRSDEEIEAAIPQTEEGYTTTYDAVYAAFSGKAESGSEAYQVLGQIMKDAPELFEILPGDTEYNGVGKEIALSNIKNVWGSDVADAVMAAQSDECTISDAAGLYTMLYGFYKDAEANGELLSDYIEDEPGVLDEIRAFTDDMHQREADTAARNAAKAAQAKQDALDSARDMLRQLSTGEVNLTDDQKRLAQQVNNVTEDDLKACFSGKSAAANSMYFDISTARGAYVEENWDAELCMLQYVQQACEMAVARDSKLAQACGMTLDEMYESNPSMRPNAQTLWQQGVEAYGQMWSVDNLTEEEKAGIGIPGVLLASGKLGWGSFIGGNLSGALALVAEEDYDIKNNNAYTYMQKYGPEARLIYRTDVTAAINNMVDEDRKAMYLQMLADADLNDTDIFRIPLNLTWEDLQNAHDSVMAGREDTMRFLNENGTPDDVSWAVRLGSTWDAGLKFIEQAALTGLTGNPELASFATFFPSSFGEGYEFGRQNGLSVSQSQMLGFVLGAVDTVTENDNVEKYIMPKASQYAKDTLSTFAADLLSKDGLKGAAKLWNKAAAGVIRYAGNYQYEFAQEELQNILGGAVKSIAIGDAAPLQEELSLDNTIETALVTGMSSGIMTIEGGIMNWAGKKLGAWGVPEASDNESVPTVEELETEIPHTTEQEQPVAVEQEQPAVEQPVAAEQEQPAVEQEQPAVEQEQPVAEQPNVEQPATAKEQMAAINEEMTAKQADPELEFAQGYIKQATSLGKRLQVTNLMEDEKAPRLINLMGALLDNGAKKMASKRADDSTTGFYPRMANRFIEAIETYKKNPTQANKDLAMGLQRDLVKAFKTYLKKANGVVTKANDEKAAAADSKKTEADTVKNDYRAQVEQLWQNPEAVERMKQVQVGKRVAMMEMAGAIEKDKNVVTAKAAYDKANKKVTDAEASYDDAKRKVDTLSRSLKRAADAYMADKGNTVLKERFDKLTKQLEAAKEKRKKALSQRNAAQEAATETEAAYKQAQKDAHEVLRGQIQDQVGAETAQIIEEMNNPKQAEQQETVEQKTEQPKAEETIQEQPVAEQEQQAVEQPVVEQPVAEQPVAEQPVAEQPVQPEPVEQPVPAAVAAAGVPGIEKSAEQPTGKVGERQFAVKTGQNAQVLNNETKQALLSVYNNRFYTKDTNNAQMLRAIDRIAENGTDATFERLMSTENMDVDDTVEAQLLLGMYFTDDYADPEKAMALAGKYGQLRTETARALQAGQIINKMTPTGMNIWIASHYTNRLKEAMRDKPGLVTKAMNSAAEVTSTVDSLDATEASERTDNKWHEALNDQQRGLIDFYGLKDTPRLGLNYNKATLDQRIVESILMTKDMFAPAGDGMNMVQRIELAKNGLPVILPSDTAYITERMREYARYDTAEEATHTSRDAMEAAYKTEDAKERRALVHAVEFAKHEAQVALARAYEAAANIEPSKNMEKVRTFAYTNMLLSIPSAERNIIGNGLQNLMNYFADKVAVGLDKRIAKKTGVRTRASITGQDKAVGWDVFVEETMNTIRDHFIDHAGTRPEGARYSPNMKGRVFQSKVLEHMRNIEGFLMSSGDRNFWAMAYTNAMAEQKRLAQINGVPFDADAAEVQARLDAAYAIFNENNELSNIFSQLKREGGVSGLVFELNNPFTGVPTNIVRRMWQFSPGGLVATWLRSRQAATIKRGESFDQRKYVDGMARGLTGTAAYLLGMALFATGCMKPGTGKEDDEKKYGVESALGDQYSPFISLFGKNVSLSAFSPAASPMVMGMLFANELSKLDKGEELFNAVWNGAMAMGDLILDASYFSGMKSLFDGDGSALENLALSTAQNAVSMITPAFLSQIASAIDPYVRDTKDKNEIMRILKYGIMNRLPGIRQMLPEKVDVAGRTVKNSYQGAAAYLNPFNTTNADNDPVMRDMLRLANDTGDTSFMPRDITYFTLNKKKYTFTREEHTEFMRYYGQRWHDAAQRSGYQSVDDKFKPDLYKKITEDAYNDAKNWWASRHQ